MVSIFLFTWLKQEPEASNKLTELVSNPPIEQKPLKQPMPQPSATPLENASLTRTLALHKEWAKYPPNSRPLDEGAVDLIHPNYIEEPLNDAIFVDDAGNIGKADFKCRFQPEKHRLTHEDDKQTLIFYCINSIEEAHEVDIRSISGTGNNPNGEWEIKAEHLEYERDTVQDYAEQDIEGWRIEFKNSKEVWGDIHLTLEYTEPGNSNRFTLNKAFVITNRSVGEFTNEFKEKIQNGSLIIDAEVDIFEAGWYQFNANLRNEEGYIAAASYEVQLPEGKHSIPFLFFGKIFHDKAATGPYTMTGIRGDRISSPVDDLLSLPPEQFHQAAKNAVYDHPPVEPLSPAKPYETHNYELESFSSLEYQSDRNDQHQEIIKALLSAESDE